MFNQDSTVKATAENKEFFIGKVMIKDSNFILKDVQRRRQCMDNIHGI